MSPITSCRADRALSIALLLSCLASLGCFGGGGWFGGDETEDAEKTPPRPPAPTIESILDDPTIESHLSGYPPAALPWKMQPGSVRVDRGITYRHISPAGAPLSGASARLYEPLARLVSLRDDVVVIYPDAEVGWAIASAGHDRPWRRIPLWDKGDQPSICALDAVANPAHDTAHAILRTCEGAVMTLQWRPEAMTAPTLQPVGSAPATSCADVGISVRDDGREDIVYGALTHAWRPDATSPWEWTSTWRPADDTLYNQQGGVMSAPERGVGCRNAITYDESARPILFTTLLGQSVDLYHVIAALRLGANGAWQPPLLYTPRNDYDDTSWPGIFAVERRPEGMPLIGSGTGQDRLGLTPFTTRGLFDGRGFMGLDASPFTFSCGSTCVEVVDHAHVRDTAFIGRTPCGGQNLWLTRERLSSATGPVNGIPTFWPSFRVPSMDPIVRGCPVTRRAPVLWDPRAHALAETDVADVIFSHGERAYDAGLCVGHQGELVICHGGHGEQVENPYLLGGAWVGDEVHLSDPILPDEVIAIAAADIAEGEVVEPGRTRFEITLSQWRGPDAALPSIWDMWTGASLEVQRTFDESNRKVTIDLARPLVPGHHYRLVLSTVNDPAGQDFAAFHFGARREIFFSAAGDVFSSPDPRDEPVTSSCSLNACLEFVELPEQGSFSFVLGRPLGLPLPDGARGADLSALFSLHDEDGEEIPITVRYEGRARAVFHVTLGQTIDPARKSYVLSLPQFFDELGHPLDPTLHTFERTLTTLPTIKVASSTPIDGDMDAHLQGPIVIELDAAVTPDVLDQISLIDVASGMEIVTLPELTTLSEDGRTLTIVHGLLMPMREYRLTLAAPLLPLDTQAFAPREEPIVITFVTGFMS